MIAEVCHHRRDTRHGTVQCRKDWGHPGDHIGHAPDPDGELLRVGWHHNFPNFIDVTPVSRSDLYRAETP